MNKSIELTTNQIKAREQGAKMFIVPIEGYSDWVFEGISLSNARVQVPEELFANFRLHKNSKTTQGHRLPVQKGDKDIFIKEEFSSHGDHSRGTVYYIADYVDRPKDVQQIEYHYGIFNASEMTKEQSRDTMSGILDVRVVRVQNLSILDIRKITNVQFDSDTMLLIRYRENELNKILKDFNRTYEDNDYIFLIEEK